MSAKSRNPDVRMQVVTSNDKAGTEGVEDPDYENMTFAFKHQDKFKSREKLPRNSGPAQRGHPSAPASPPHCLNKAILSLYILLAVTFIFLSVYILIENSKMSNKLEVLSANITMLNTNLMVLSMNMTELSVNLTKLRINLQSIYNLVKAGQKNQTMHHGDIMKKIDAFQKTTHGNLTELKDLVKKLPTLQQVENILNQKLKLNASTSSRK